jgi:hypothetical protein
MEKRSKKKKQKKKTEGILPHFRIQNVPVLEFCITLHPFISFIKILTRPFSAAGETRVCRNSLRKNVSVPSKGLSTITHASQKFRTTDWLRRKEL